MLSELRQAIRLAFKHPAFSLSAVLILGLGCAATTAIFSVAYGVMLRDLPYPEAERLVGIGSRWPKTGLATTYAGAADYFDWRKRQQAFEDIALTRPVGSYNLTGAGEPERLLGARTTASLFRTLRVTPLIGRTFTEEEQLDPRRASTVAVISHGLWQRRFGGDPAIVGRKIRLNGMDAEIVGVMRPEFRYPSRDFELWTPLYYPPGALQTRTDFSYLCVGRSRPGVTLEQARARMDAIAANLAREYPATNKDAGVYVKPLLGFITESTRPALWLMIAAVGTLFLVGCVNLANILLARASGRTREFAIRAALGANRTRVIRQIFFEVLPLAAAGAGVGVLGANWLLAALIPLLPSDLPRVEDITLHGPVLAFCVALSLVATFAVSIVPAMQVSASLQRGPASHARVRDILIAAEVACTVVLLVSAGLLSRSFLNLRSEDPGFEPSRVLTFQLAVSRAAHGGEDRGVADYLSRLIGRVQSVPGVESAGIVNRLPMSGQAQSMIVGFEGADGAVQVDSRSVSGDYFRTLGIPLIAGRTFTERDSATATPAGIIDEQLARRVFGNASPIGKRFRISVAPGFPWIEIVGVVGHIRHYGLATDPRPQAYWPYRQRTEDRMAMAIKTAGDPGAMTSSIRAAIREVDSEQALYDVRPMTEVVGRTLTGQRLGLLLVGSFAAFALLLATLGLNGVVSHLTALRAREFGIRLAVGADPSDVLRIVLGQGLARACAGLAAGLVLAGLGTRLLSGMVHGVATLDAATYAGVAALLLLTVAFASYWPARRAARMDPVTILRSE